MPPALTDLGAARAAVLLAAEGGTVRAPQPYGAPLAAPRRSHLPKSDVARAARLHARRRCGRDARAARRSASRSTTRAAMRSPSARRRGAATSRSPPIWSKRSRASSATTGSPKRCRPSPISRSQRLPSIATTRLATTLAGLGYHECITLGLQPAAVAERDRAPVSRCPTRSRSPIPLSEDQRYLRYSLLARAPRDAARDRVRPLPHVRDRARLRGRNDPTGGNATSLVTLRPARRSPNRRGAACGVSRREERRAGLAARADRDASRRSRAERAAGLHPGKTAEIVDRRRGRGLASGVSIRACCAPTGSSDDAVASHILEIDALPPKATRHVCRASRSFRRSSATSRCPRAGRAGGRCRRRRPTRSRYVRTARRLR